MHLNGGQTKALTDRHSSASLAGIFGYGGIGASFRPPACLCAPSFLSSRAPYPLQHNKDPLAEATLRTGCSLCYSPHMSATNSHVLLPTGCRSSSKKILEHFSMMFICYTSWMLLTDASGAAVLYFSNISLNAVFCLPDAVWCISEWCLYAVHFDCCWHMSQILLFFFHIIFRTYPWCCYCMTDPVWCISECVLPAPYILILRDISISMYLNVTWFIYSTIY